MRSRPPTHSLDGTFLAALSSALLSPFFAYLSMSTFAGIPLAGLVLGLFVVPFFPMVAAPLFVFILVSTFAAGLTLSHLRVRHVALFAAMGAGVALMSWGFGPGVFSLSERVFLPKQPTTGDAMLTICAMAVAGALNGAVYWLIARHFSRLKAPVTGVPRL
jgi:hypothetical protein